MKHDPITFIGYNMDQLYVPMDLEIHIPKNHVCRIVNQAVEHIDLNPSLFPLQRSGRPPYHPKMMLKVLLYTYTQKVYSSRNIAKSFEKIFISCGFPVTNNPISARSIDSV
jgi:transposase